MFCFSLTNSRLFRRDYVCTVSRYHSHLRSTSAILQLYTGGVPFALWLKNYFKQHKKFGSTDRRTIADLCFCFFRLGTAFANESVEEQILIGQFLCRDESPFVKELKPSWQKESSLSLEEKLAFLNVNHALNFFPFLADVSEEIDHDLFNLSHLVQPDLFLRARPGKRELVMNKLQNAAFVFSVEGDCFRLPIASKIEDVLQLDKEVVVQDKSSQRVLDLLQPSTPNPKPQTLSAWDCCAASGGKSILLHDAFPRVRLTVSDVRESILHNLRNRFGRAGINGYESFVADVSSPQFNLKKKFDLIICDAPCSGSGTWGRTPESLRFFKREKFNEYAALQKAISVNASRTLKEGGFFLYITCSVLKMENEEVVEHLVQNANLRLLKQEYFKGYTEKADTLFAALFTL